MASLLRTTRSKQHQTDTRPVNNFVITGSWDGGSSKPSFEGRLTCTRSHFCLYRWIRCELGAAAQPTVELGDRAPVSGWPKRARAGVAVPCGCFDLHEGCIAAVGSTRGISELSGPAMSALDDGRSTHEPIITSGISPATKGCSRQQPRYPPPFAPHVGSFHGATTGGQTSHHTHFRNKSASPTTPVEAVTYRHRGQSAITLDISSSS